jgi:hypothetical protein
MSPAEVGAELALSASPLTEEQIAAAANILATVTEAKAA